MKDGYVNLKTTDSALVGVAGSGKTSSLTVVLTKKPPPAKRGSTPCAKKPVRIRIGVNGKDDISTVAVEEYVGSVAHTAKNVATSLTASNSPLDPPTTTHDDYMRKTEDELLRHLSEDTSHTHTPLLNTVRWNNMTDTGGQPQFLQMLPIFVHHISLAIFTINLNERLDHYPDIEYYEDGEQVGKSFKSRDTHEQIIRRCMRVLVSQARGTKKFKLLFIGTRRDCVCKEESIEEKNKQLRIIINSFKLTKHVLYSNLKDLKIIFAINAKNPKIEDPTWEVIKQVRTEIVKCTDIDPISIPVRWFALELALLRFVKETKPKQVMLAESECLTQVTHLHFTKEGLKEALKYLHKAKLIIYLEKKGLVMADMELIQIKLSEIVGYHIKLTTEPTTEPKLLSALDDMWMKFCRQGILNIKCLQRFPSHFKEGLFSPKDLLELFADLNIVSKLPDSKLDGSEQFLMPCLLLEPDPKTQVKMEPDPTTHTAHAIAIEFPNGGPLLGTFCRLICYLMNEKEWSLAIHPNGDPRQLTRNSVEFSKYPGGVTIHDPLSTLFVITYPGPTMFYPLILDTILTAISAIENQQYFPQDNVATVSSKPLVTFVCSCGTKTTPLHSAIVDNAGFLSCPSSSYFEEMTAKHKAWLSCESCKE